MIKIRIAVPEDEISINELFEEMLRSIYHTQNVEGYEDGYLKQFWNGGENRIFLAEDDEVVAFLSVQVYREPERYLYLDDFSVTERCRNRGIGTELMHMAEAYAKEIELPAIILHVEKSNAGAFHFYERLGYSIFRDDGSRYLLKKDDK